MKHGTNFGLTLEAFKIYNLFHHRQFTSSQKNLCSKNGAHFIIIDEMDSKEKMRKESQKKMKRRERKKETGIWEVCKFTSHGNVGMLNLIIWSKP